MKDKNGDALKDTTDIAPFIQAAEPAIFLQIEKTLNRIGLKFDQFFNENSLYESGEIEEVVAALRQKGLIYEKEGATWFKATKTGRDQDRVIIKSNGEPTYRLPDIAYHRNKFERGYDLIVDILGVDHMDAYPDVLAGIEQLGYDTNKVKVLIHQFVTLMEKGEPVKMSTRKAQYIPLDELIDEVGQDVVRYFFIMRGMNTHLNFDMDIAKSESEENPVFYLQYAYARICNIINRSNELNYKIFDKISDSNEFNSFFVKYIVTREPREIAQALSGKSRVTFDIVTGVLREGSQDVYCERLLNEAKNVPKLTISLPKRRK